MMARRAGRTCRQAKCGRGRRHGGSDARLGRSRRRRLGARGRRGHRPATLEEEADDAGAAAGSATAPRDEERAEAMTAAAARAATPIAPPAHRRFAREGGSSGTAATESCTRASQREGSDEVSTVASLCASSGDNVWATRPSTTPSSVSPSIAGARSTAETIRRRTSMSGLPTLSTHEPTSPWGAGGIAASSAAARS